MEKDLETLYSELEVLKENVQKRKKEITNLKIMLYTGMILLMLAFFYASNTLQRAQLRTLESNLDAIKTIERNRLERLQQEISGEVMEMRKDLEFLSQEYLAGAGSPLERSINAMNNTLTLLKPPNPRVEELITQLRQDSTEFLNSYQQHTFSSKTGRR